MPGSIPGNVGIFGGTTDAVDSVAPVRIAAVSSAVDSDGTAIGVDSDATTDGMATGVDSDVTTDGMATEVDSGVTTDGMAEVDSDATIVPVVSEVADSVARETTVARVPPDRTIHAVDTVALETTTDSDGTPRSDRRGTKGAAPVLHVGLIVKNGLRKNNLRP